MNPEQLKELYDFCIASYKKKFNQKYSTMVNEESSKSAKENARRISQRDAVDETFVQALMKYSGEISAEDSGKGTTIEKHIWTAIGSVHKLNLANLGELGVDPSVESEVYRRCISAQQSWIKTSGHSFERYISNLSNQKLQDNEISFILQSELTALIKNKKLSNTEKDIDGLRKWGKDFDLYAIQRIHGETHVFGCIQSKTSIRDRVGRDRPFSLNAMENLFWSAAVTLDGTFLNMPEFQSLVNGGGSYDTNSWHGMYAMSGILENMDRIYLVNDQMDLFIDHAISAAKQFIKDRRQLDCTWKA